MQRTNMKTLRQILRYRHEFGVPQIRIAETLGVSQHRLSVPDESAAPTVPATPVRLEEDGAHNRDTLAARFDPPPVARPAVPRQAPEIGAGWISVHVRICAGGAQ